MTIDNKPTGLSVRALDFMLHMIRNEMMIHNPHFGSISEGTKLDSKLSFWMPGSFAVCMVLS
jgi:hypothetical protein